MNLEIAARLVELRKKHGLSQEELADKLGVSRQAVSKWERVEASPDTDNLIALAKLYGISLDDLLNYSPENPIKDNPADARTDDTENKADEKSDTDGDDGFSFTSKDDKKTKVHIGPKGIFVQDGEDVVDLSWGKGIHISSADDKKEFHHNPGEPWHVFEDEKTRVGAIVDSVVFVLSIVAYVAASAPTGLWHPLWLIFFFAPLLSVPFDLKKFNAVFPLVVTGTFLTLGLVLGAWHPGWVVFLALPAYYTLADAVKKIRKPSHKVEISSDNED